NCSKATRKIAVISYPYMSNYNDFEPLIADPDIYLEFINSNVSLEKFDEVILPGSKLVIKDLRWLKSTGLFEQIRQRTKPITGICGGYQMMFENIIDELCIETQTSTKEPALGFIDDNIIFMRNKTLSKKRYKVFKKYCDGFEIHHGISKKYPLSFEKNNIKGTFVHGLYDDEKFQIHKKKTIDDFVSVMKNKLDIDTIYKSIVE
ncbi:MAG: cobyric acid synthase CobQ, partial [Arcobacteraceae bacterium]